MGGRNGERERMRRRRVGGGIFCFFDPREGLIRREGRRGGENRGERGGENRRGGNNRHGRWLP